MHPIMPLSKPLDSGRLLVAWTVATMLAWTVYVPIFDGLVKIDIFNVISRHDMAVLLLALLIPGTAIALAQWMALRGHLSQAWHWIVATLGGVALCTGLGLLLLLLEDGAGLVLLGVVPFGLLVVAVSQGLVLFRADNWPMTVLLTGLWIVAKIVATLAAMSVFNVLVSNPNGGASALTSPR